MTWPVVIAKLAEIGLDEYAPTLKDLGYDDIDAFDSSDKEALKKIADELGLKPGHKAKFVKKFSEAAAGEIAKTPAPNQIMPTMSMSNSIGPISNESNNTNNNSVVVNVGDGGGGGPREGDKIPCGWLVGEWTCDKVQPLDCCNPITCLVVAAAGADAFEMRLGHKMGCGGQEEGPLTFTRQGGTNNFNPMITSGLLFNSGCCGGDPHPTTGVLAQKYLQVMIIVDENNLRGSNGALFKKITPTNFKEGNADADAMGIRPAVMSRP
jgi:hypothetical protein